MPILILFYLKIPVNCETLSVWFIKWVLDFTNKDAIHILLVGEDATAYPATHA